jgi:putative pyruvate formate lyase activating enzyme
MSDYTHCQLCPRNCGKNREAGERGVCGETAALRIAWAGLHFGEEPPLIINSAGEKVGSGTIFVSGCGLRCSFCQNWQISGDGFSGDLLGRETPPDQFAAICLALQEHGAANINIVTGTHASPALAAGLRLAKTRGLRLPVLWNCGGYESSASMAAVEDLVDVWLPDLKTLDTSLASTLFHAPDYPDAAARAIKRMVKLRPLCWSGEPDDSALKSGVMVRHLVLPGRVDSTIAVLKWFAKHCAGWALLSLMTQYTPIEQTRNKGAPARYLNEAEYAAVLDALDDLGLENGYFQELENDADWLPDFERDNPFPSKLSKTVYPKTG